MSKVEMAVVTAICSVATGITALAVYAAFHLVT